MSTETYSESKMMASNLSLKVKWNEKTKHKIQKIF